MTAKLIFAENQMQIYSSCTDFTRSEERENKQSYEQKLNENIRSRVDDRFSDASNNKILSKA